MKIPYIILEVANSHGGDFNYISSLIKEFQYIKSKCGFKFQPFRYNLLSQRDFEWYQVYKNLFFSEKEWKKIISSAHRFHDVWLDIFDDYSIKILTENLNKIKGIKLQSSVLFNKKTIQKLIKLNLFKKKIIINISGIKIDELKYFINNFQKHHITELILQIGFQNYPTSFNDSGFNKISKLRKHFNYNISFADHFNPSDDNYLRHSIYPIKNNINLIEKHIMHSSLQTRYDFQSSCNIKQFREYINFIHKSANIKPINLKKKNTSFICANEKKYLEASMLTPILSKNILTKRPISIIDDIDFRRTNAKGLNTIEIMDLQKRNFILKKNVFKGKTMTKNDFKKAKVATIIACRMKSSRLKQKALCKIGPLTSIELCIKNALNFKNVDLTVLATSDLKSDQILKKYKYSRKVEFFAGSPNDVVNRYVEVIKKYNIDVFIRVTGDMPFVSNEVLKVLLESHFSSSADFTTAKKATLGTNLEIINSSSLLEIQNFFPHAEHSEYMSWYFKNNKNKFKINQVKIPDSLVSNHRLTIDYEEDLEMFNILNSKFQFNRTRPSLSKIISFLDKNRKISSINRSITPVYLSNAKLINKLKKETRIKI